MKIKTAVDYPARSGIISGFAAAPTEYLEMIRADLRLGMPMAVLSRLQNHYRYSEHRDPFVGELIMFDILYLNSAERALNQRKHLITELLTDSEEIKNSYSDLMQKLNYLYPEREGPVNMTALAKTASEYLARLTGAEASPIKNMGERAPELIALCAGDAVNAELKAGDVSFCLANKGEQPQIKNGVFILLSASYSLLPLMRELRKEAGFVFRAEMIKHNIIESVLGLCDNAELFVPLDLPFSATDGRGDILLMCEESSAQIICMMASSKGVTAKPMGRNLGGGGIRFVFENRPPLSLKTHILRQMTSHAMCENVSLKIRADGGDSRCAFLPVKGEYSSAQTLSAIETDLSSAPYKSGKDMIIRAVASAISSGADIDSISISCLVRYPRYKDPSELAAFLLGAYRSQIELAAGADIDFDISESIIEPYALAISHAECRTDCSGNFGSLYLIYPAAKGEAFGNIRKTFSYINALISDNMAKRVCALDSNEDAGHGAGTFLVLTDAILEGTEGVIAEKIGEAKPAHEEENL